MATLEMIKQMVDDAIERTPRDAGTTLTITVTRYDNGLLMVNGIPKDQGEQPYNEAVGWLDVNETIAQMLRRFLKIERPAPRRN